MPHALRRVVAVHGLAASAWDGQVWPSRPPTHKEAADSGASDMQALSMPWFPTHNITCGGRLCRPGEGNLKGYRFWGQPYIHREEFVQAQSRRPPHQPEPWQTSYTALVHVARRVAQDNLVLLTAADWDYREIVLNWALHARRLGYRNAVVLAMDRELAAELRRRGIPSADNSANLDAWNATCLQRHIQRVRHERILAIAALVTAGLDVLHTDATVVLVRDVLPFLRAQPAELDFLVQREGGPPAAVERLGCGLNSGFAFVRAARGQAAARFLVDAVQRGLVEFYNRWNNVGDKLGWSFVTAAEASRQPAGAPKTSQLDNATSVLHLPKRGLRVAFLPYDRFPRIGDWSVLRETALIHSLVGDGSLGDQFAHAFGSLPFRGHRQRLDRYDETDFETYVGVMRQCGLWLYESHHGVHIRN